MHLQLVFLNIPLLRRLFAVGLLAAVALSSQPASAQEGGFGAMASKLNPMNWSMPKPAFRLPNFMVQHDDQDRIVERKNTLVTDVKSTASRSWQRTKETFSPARLNPMNLFAGPSETSAPPAKNEPNLFQSMFSTQPKEPEARIAGVNDFLDQQRPR